MTGLHLLDGAVFALTFAAALAVFLGLERLEARRFDKHTDQALDLTKEN